MKFKMNDKVVVIVCDRTCRKYKNKTGKITSTGRIKRGLSTQWDYKVTFDDGFNYPFSSTEIKKAVIKNQQLLFNFMRK